jgi:hypothetical protein
VALVPPFFIGILVPVEAGVSALAKSLIPKPKAKEIAIMKIAVIRPVR